LFHGGIANADIMPSICYVRPDYWQQCTGRVHPLNYFLTVEVGVNLVERQKRRRRDDLPAEFPLKDSDGVFIFHDRRQLHDRRKKKYGLDDLKIVLMKMSN
jgi:hypothetical protein